MDFQADKPYIFISYSHVDSDAVLPIINTLKQNNINVWYDDGIEAGSEWPEYIAQKIVSCDRFICFLSDAYPLSQNCSRELNFAIAEKKEVLSIFLKEKVSLPAGMRMQLGSYQSVFLSRHKSTQSFCDYLCKENFIIHCSLGRSVRKNNSSVSHHSTGVDETSVNAYKKPPQKPTVPKKESDPKPENKPAENSDSAQTQKKKPSKLKRFIAILVLCILAKQVWSSCMYVTFYGERFRYAFTAAMIILGLVSIVRMFLCTLLSAGKFKSWMIFLISTLIEFLLNYYLCFLICNIPLWYNFLSVVALIAANAIIAIVEFIIVALIDD